MLTAFLLLVIAFLLFVIWSQRRIREPRLSIESDASIDTLARSLAGLTHGRLVGGNSVELFDNGAFFDTLFDDIGRAQSSVHVEEYLWADGELSRRVVRALAERAAAGVEVRMLADAWGSKKVSDATCRELRSAGCRLEFYRDARLRNIGLQNSRDHRKLIVIDGRIAFVGGHCFKDHWLGNAENAQRYRDVSARLRGPIVHAAQATFGENWVEATGELFLGAGVFPELEPAGDVEAHVASLKPIGSAPPAVRILYHLVLCVARRRIFIQNPYFLPDDDAIAALGDAVQRGVDVRVMTPAAAVSDMPFVQHAAHRNFSKLLAAGVRILEYQPTLLHQKMITIDGAWCVIGSANFDERSLDINDEVAVAFRSAKLAKRFEEVFHEDAKKCVAIDAANWASRGVLHRLKDHSVYTLKYQL
jgi:cardiolipin synthase